MDLKKHTRRDFLRLAGLSTAGVIVAACAGEPEVVEKIVQETVEVVKEVEKEVTVIVEAEPEVEAEVEEEVEEEVAEVAGKYQESPMLAERVAAGELPPVDERLPEEPRICEIMGEIGEYGGTLTVATLSQNLYGDDGSMAMDRPTMLRIGHDGGHATEHVLKGWEQSDDFTSVTMHMRKGLKWSDGEPLTSADFKFYYEDMMLNAEITPLPATYFRWGGEVMKLDIIDDYNFKLTFAKPQPAFVLVNMAHWYGWWDNNQWVPAHYLKEFHIKYNDKANDLATEDGYDFWYQLLGYKNNRSQNPDRPRLECYVPKTTSPQATVMERNPYYHAVDPEGKQLPYIDQMIVDKCADLSILDAKTVGGTYDFAAFQLRILNYATYAEGAAASGATMYLWPSGKGGEVVYNWNSNWPDEEMRTVFQDDRWHQAMSLAVNRADINNVIYFGNATETQYTVIPASKYYKPEYSTAYAEFDIDRANALLDEMGLTWNEAKTHRQWPVSKNDIVISWDLVETETPKGPITELVTEYWKAVGVEMQWKSITRTLLTQKIAAMEEPMSLWHGDESADTLFLRRPKFFSPLDGDENTWAPLWGRWYNTGGEQGEEPPQVIKDLYTWQDEFLISESPEAADNTLKSEAEHVWTCGVIGNAPHPLLVRDTLMNVSKTGGFWTWDTGWTYTEFPEQWWIKQA